MVHIRRVSERPCLAVFGIALVHYHHWNSVWNAVFQDCETVADPVRGAGRMTDAADRSAIGLFSQSPGGAPGIFLSMEEHMFTIDGVGDIMLVRE